MSLDQLNITELFAGVGLFAEDIQHRIASIGCHFYYSCKSIKPQKAGQITKRKDILVKILIYTKKIVDKPECLCAVRKIINCEQWRLVGKEYQINQLLLIQ